MRARQFEEQTVDEVAMNPTTFAQAIEQGQTSGVLVGFEFEVCIPEATFNVPQQGDETKPEKNIPGILNDENILENLDLNEVSPEQWDSVFRFKNPPPTGFKTMVEAHAAYTNQLVNHVKDLYYKIPEKARKKYQTQALEYAADDVKRLGVKKRDPRYSTEIQLAFAHRMGRLVYMHTRGETERAGRELMYTMQQDWENLLKFVFNAQNVAQLVRQFDQLFEYDVDAAYNLLDLASYEDDDDDFYDDDNGDYASAAGVLQPAVAQAMGAKVNIFSDYHQSRKNLTDWYIEPDGSLSSDNDNDATAEIVSPPLPAQTAVAALQSFYQLAAQMNLYTNRSTGLHINVSIPQKLDVLKLAVFLGDQHVLKYFGRQDSRYAVSAERSIGTGVARMDVANSRSKDPLQTKMLQKIAQDSTKDHVASISNNGKYISFRHAGGNYLQDYQGIFNVVGRFIRAMIIAADPNAYAQEYKTKLSKLVGTARNTKAAPDDQATTYLRTQGTPTLTLTFGVITRAKTDKVIKGIAEKLGIPAIPRKIDLVPGGLDAQNYIISRMQSENAKDNAARIPQQNMFVATLYPANAADLTRFINLASSQAVNSTVNSNYDRQSYFTVDKSLLPPQDPYTQALLKQVLQIRYSK
jgi:hypothetical protein